MAHGEARAQAPAAPAPPSAELSARAAQRKAEGNEGAQLDRSERLVELMKQDANAPIPAEQQALVLYAGTRGLLDDLRLSDLRRFERELLALVASEHRGLLDDLAHQRIDAGLGDRIREAVLQLKKSFGA
jgi:F-type H+-transporting ATPase subunit alpha